MDPQRRRNHYRWIASVSVPLALATFTFPQGNPRIAAVNPAGITFLEGSTSTVLVERDGKKYLVDLVSHEVREQDALASSSSLSSDNPPSSPKVPQPKQD